jgi:hypothetical protein
MSSDSGSQGNFREMEDGFAAYAASKAALNMAVRHLAAELKRKDDDTIILAMHPGEVATDMANVQLPWEVQGIISPEESVAKMIEVIKSKGIQHSGTFWTYENKVSGRQFVHRMVTDRYSLMFGDEESFIFLVFYISFMLIPPFVKCICIKLLHSPASLLLLTMCRDPGC